MITHSVEETNIAARQWLESLAASVPSNIDPSSTTSPSATVVGLEGNLGSGKTTFVQAVAHALGITDVVTSPTFVIQKRYLVTDEHYLTKFHNLIHIDAYRIDQADELAVIGFGKLLVDRQNLILIEWPERVAGLLPADAHRIYFKFIDENTRSIESDDMSITPADAAEARP